MSNTERDSKREKPLLRDIRGPTTIEYIIILSLVAVMGYAAWYGFGTKVLAAGRERGACPLPFADFKG